MMIGVLLVTLVGCGSTKTKPTNAQTTTQTNAQDDKKDDIKVTATNLSKERQEQLLKIAKAFGEYHFTRDYKTFTIEDYNKSLDFFTKDIQDMYKEANDGETTLEKEKEQQTVCKVTNFKATEISDYKDNAIEVDYTLTVFIETSANKSLVGQTKKVNCRVIFNQDNKIIAFANGNYE